MEYLVTIITGIVSALGAYFTAKKQIEGRKVDSESVIIENAKSIASAHQQLIDDLKKQVIGLTERLQNLEGEVLTLKTKNLDLQSELIECKAENKLLKRDLAKCTDCLKDYQNGNTNI